MPPVQLLDALDARILLALDDDPEGTTLALARTLGMSRNTVHARLRRMAASGALREPSLRVDLAALGRPVVAFLSVALRQADRDRATAALQRLPEVVEMHSTTGDADLLLKVAVRDPADLHRVTSALLAVEGVERTSTAVSLHQDLPLRHGALLASLAGDGPAEADDDPAQADVTS